MRQIDHRLYNPLEFQFPYLVEQQRKAKGDNNIQHQLGHGNNDCIDYDPFTVTHGEQVAEILQPCEFGANKSTYRVIILKGHYNTEHRHDIKQDQPYHSDQDHGMIA